MSTLHLKKLPQGAINYLSSIFNLSISTGKIPEIWLKAIIIPILWPGKDNNIGINWHQIYCAQRPRCRKSSCCPKYRHSSLFTMLKMAFGRNTRHALHCRQSPPKLQPVSQEKSRLNEQCSSRSIWQLHSTLWTINNCWIVSSTPSYRQQSVAGSTVVEQLQNRRAKVNFRQR